MSISLRFYLFTEAGMQRISQRVMDGLCHGEDAMPQFAETKQKIAAAVVEFDNRKPLRILDLSGSYLEFDQQGRVLEGYLAQSVFEAMETFDALERSKRVAPSKVVNLAPKLNREKWEREHRWQPTAKDMDDISADIWKQKKADSVKIVQTKSAKPAPPKMTYEATEAIREIQTQISRVNFKLEALSETALKGVAFEARERAAEDNNAVWLGVADAADRRREILARHRTGKGMWYASIQLTHWDATGNSGRCEDIVHEKYNSKKEAEVAARRLLAENAKYFSASTSVEADVVCDLEWDNAAEEAPPARTGGPVIL